MTPEAVVEALASVPAFADAAIGGLQRLSGGASLETWAFTAGDRDYVLRRRAVPPAAGAEGISLATEAALLRAAAAAGAPVPEVICVSGAGEQPLGEAHVTRRVVGETLGRKIVSGADFEGVRPRLARQCGEVLARIHTMAVDVPLATHGFTEELESYHSRYVEFGAHRPVLDLAFQWLRRVAPPSAEPVVVHGDFRNGNLIVSPTAGVVAVLDWELAHRGDPASDLGWICVNSWRFGGSSFPVGGFGTYGDLLAGYAAAGGRPITLAAVRAWQALGSLKWGVMCLGMYASYALGINPSVERPMIGRRVSETEIDLLALMERGL